MKQVGKLAIKFEADIENEKDCITREDMKVLFSVLANQLPDKIRLAGNCFEIRSQDTTKDMGAKWNLETSFK